jgi:hypothetical protein
MNMNSQVLIALAGLCLLAASTAARGQTPAAPATRPAPSQPPSLSADQMLNRLLSARGEQGKPLQPAATDEADATSGSGAVAPGAPTISVLREGSVIVDRVGRLTRSTDGQRAEFTLEADGKALRDPPLIILPNQKLMLMEEAVKTSSRDLRFRVTGLITEYRGRNYILLEKVVGSPDSEQP